MLLSHGYYTCWTNGYSFRCLMRSIKVYGITRISPLNIIYLCVFGLELLLDYTRTIQLCIDLPLVPFNLICVDFDM